MAAPETVLVTGATGSVCMNLCESLLRNGHRVIMCARHPLHRDDEAELRRLPGELLFANADVMDPGALSSIVRSEKVTQVMHGAAMTPSMDMERDQGKRVIEINCLGVVNALDAARSGAVKRFIYLGSVSAYGEAAFEGAPLEEGVSVARPNSLYELSKFTAERIVVRYRQLFGMQAHVARIGDVFGPWEHYSGVRPWMSFPYQTTYRAMRGEEVLLPRPCLQDWVYSRDIAASLVAMMDAPELKYDIYPLCSGRLWPITDWCALLAKRFPGFRYGLADDPDKATIRVNQSRDNAPMSTRRLIEDTGYTPAYGLDGAFADYMDWLDRHPGYMER